MTNSGSSMKDGSSSSKLFISSLAFWLLYELHQRIGQCVLGETREGSEADTAFFFGGLYDI